jgi:hypothetical protein
MKKIFIKLTLILVVAIGLYSCSDDYFDVNTPADAVDISELSMRDLMAPVIYRTIYAQYYSETAFGNYSQYFGSYGSGALGKTHNSSTWSQIYLYALPNLQIIKEKAIDKGAIHYEGVADILTAINIGLATDCWNNIPYSQATQGTDNTHPAFDTQEQIYNDILSLLNNGITKLTSVDNSAFVIGDDDLIYGGDIDKWIKAAYTLKARYQLHLINKGITTPQDVLTTIDNGFTSNGDDFQMYFPADINNPWYSTEILSRNTGNFYHALNDQLISMMNGTSYPFLSGVITEDPRLDKLFVKEIGTNIPAPASDPWRGFINGGDGESSDGEPGNTYFKDGGFHTSATSPLILITYAEAMFIKAEAAFLANGGTTTSVGANSIAYDAYMNGIQANMDKLGANGADYMADASVDVGINGLMLNHIMKEKYIANLLNFETYNDFRRYEFSSDVFKNLDVRIDEDSDYEYYGQWFRRAVYPSSEKDSNEAVVLANEEEPTVPLWWEE